MPTQRAKGVPDDRQAALRLPLRGEIIFAITISPAKGSAMVACGTSFFTRQTQNCREIATERLQNPHKHLRKKTAPCFIEFTR